MSDIALVWNPAEGGLDVVVEANDLLSDDGLETAALQSLFFHGYDPETPGSGWWGDLVPVVPGDRVGSRLWRHTRAKRIPATLRAIEEDARAALAWMIEDQVAARIDVSAELVRDDFWGVKVEIHRSPAGLARFTFHWNAIELRRIN